MQQQIKNYKIQFSAKIDRVANKRTKREPEAACLHGPILTYIHTHLHTYVHITCCLLVYVLACNFSWNLELFSHSINHL